MHKDSEEIVLLVEKSYLPSERIVHLTGESDRSFTSSNYKSPLQINPLRSPRESETEQDINRKLMIQKGKNQSLTILMRTISENIEQTLHEA
jgi:hypothetical protein